MQTFPRIVVTYSVYVDQYSSPSVSVTNQRNVPDLPLVDMTQPTPAQWEDLRVFLSTYAAQAMTEAQRQIDVLQEAAQARKDAKERAAS